MLSHLAHAYKGISRKLWVTTKWQLLLFDILNVAITDSLDNNQQ